LANLVNDRFLSVGGAGIGAVMGSKNLKAVAVKGQHSLQVADGSRFVQVINTLINKLNSAPLTSQSMSQWDVLEFMLRKLLPQKWTKIFLIVGLLNRLRCTPDQEALNI